MNLSSKKSKFNKPQVVVNKTVEAHSNDPFFVKKIESSKKVIEKYGLPERFANSK